MPERVSDRRRTLFSRGFLAIYAIVACAYVVSYLVLMDRQVSAFDENGDKTFDSSSRLAPSMLQHSGDSTYLLARESLVN